MDLIIPGEPRNKERARKGKGGRHYTPDATRYATDLIKALARQAWGPQKPDREPWRLRLEFHVLARHGKDGDNMEKLVMDALQGVLFVNDSQVLDCHWTIHPIDKKTMATTGHLPHTKITAERITP